MQYALSNNENSEQVMKIINHARSGGYEISSNILLGAVLPVPRHMAFHGHQPIYESWNIMEYCWKLWDHEKLSTARHGEWYKLARNWSYILLQKWNQTALACFPVYKSTNHEDNSLIWIYLFLFFFRYSCHCTNQPGKPAFSLPDRAIIRQGTWGRQKRMEQTWTASQHKKSKRKCIFSSPTARNIPSRWGFGTHGQVEPKKFA